VKHSNRSVSSSPSYLARHGAEPVPGTGRRLVPRVEALAIGDGLTPLKWSVDPKDWTRPGTAHIIRVAQSGRQDGGGLLLHDGGGNRAQTVATLSALIPNLQSHGLTFVLP